VTLKVLAMITTHEA